VKDEKAKYLIVDSTEIHNQLYNMKRECGFNDWFNVYTRDKIIAAKEIFDKYNIPREFQKIIIKINSAFIINYKSEEYVTRIPFDIQSGKIENENNEKYISMSNYPILYDCQVFEDKINFKTQFKYVKFSEVIKFLKKIDDSGFLKSYLQSVMNFMKKTVDYDYICNVTKEEINAQKVLTNYKKKYQHK